MSPGDEILVRPGERIPVDGTVLVGRAAVDQSAVTGESRHEDVGPGSPVFAGTVALDGLLRVQVRGTGADTVLGRVVGLLAEVEQATVPVLRLFERRAGVWLPLVLTLAATTLFFTEDLSRAIAVLVVATPTALVVAGPAAMVAAMTTATRLRILIKSSDFLERASEVDTLILDKTGTVTVGAPAVTEISAGRRQLRANGLLAVAAACGFGSLHPVSRAVVAEARRARHGGRAARRRAGAARARRRRARRRRAGRARPPGAPRRARHRPLAPATTEMPRRSGSRSAAASSAASCFATSPGRRLATRSRRCAASASIGWSC